MKPSELWSLLHKVADKRYNFDIGKTINDNQIIKLPFCRVALLRDLCLSIGLVLEKKKYDII